MAHTHKAVSTERGYCKLHLIQKNEAGEIIRDEPGGWVADAKRGRIWMAVCACGEAALGHSERDAEENIGAV
jgi:hypothetical protein